MYYEKRNKSKIKKIIFWILLVITIFIVIATIGSYDSSDQFSDRTTTIIMIMIFLFPWAIYSLVKLLKIEKKRRKELLSGLVACPDCGKEISKTASKCPHCGKRISSPALGFLVMLVGIIILSIVVIAIL